MKCLCDLSPELLCYIIGFLPLKDILRLSQTCKKLNEAVQLYLHLCKKLNLSEGDVSGNVPSCITDEHLGNLLQKCSNLNVIYGLRSRHLDRRKSKRSAALTVPGVVEVLSRCTQLKAVEISDLYLMENILQQLPHLNIIGHFRNEDGSFPPAGRHKFKLPSYSNITSLHLTGVKVTELTVLPQLQHLYLQWMCFTKFDPFQSFSAPNLKTFVMRNSVGPVASTGYIPLIKALSAAMSLSRLELIRVPILGRTIQNVVEDKWQTGSFCKLKSLAICHCNYIFDSDIGNLFVVASQCLELIALQSSFTKDSFFMCVSFAQCNFPKVKSLSLGYEDELPAQGDWSKDLLTQMGITGLTDLPCALTDAGMKTVCQLFPNITSLSINNCVHLKNPESWYPQDAPIWRSMTDLTFRHSPHLHLPSFSHFLANLSSLETLILEDAFREMPVTYEDICNEEQRNMIESQNNTQNEKKSLSDRNSKNKNNEMNPSKIPTLTEEEATHILLLVSRSSQTLDKALSNEQFLDESDEISAEEYDRKDRVEMEEKAVTSTSSTSTRDLLLKTSPDQVLCIVSETLISVTVISCGMSDIVIDYCDNLLHIEASACRILKRMQLNHCSNLVRINVTKCPKMKINFLIEDTVTTPATNGRLVYFQPFDKLYDKKLTERLIFHNLNYKQHVLLLHDFGSDDNDRSMHREKFLSWIRLLCQINSTLLRSNVGNLMSREDAVPCPLEDDLISIEGSFADGRYRLLTDSPWMKELWLSHLDSSKQFNYFPSPETFGYTTFDKAYSSVKESIVKSKEKKRRLYPSHVGFYVHFRCNKS